MKLIVFTLLSFIALGNLDAELQQLKKTNVLLNEALEEALADDLNSGLSRQNRALTKALEELKSQNEESVGYPGGGGIGVNYNVHMYPGSKLQPNKKLYSANGNCYLKMQTDGNLVLYRKFDQRPFWFSGTSGGGGYAIFQPDGNFVIYKGNSVKWAINKYNLGATRLTLQDDGNIVVAKKNGQVLWSSGSYGRRACATGAFDVIMASDTQYTYTKCNNPSTGTDGYALANKDWCEKKGAFYRINNLMNGIWDSLREKRKLTGKPIGANIIGDLTQGAEKSEERMFANKVRDIESGGYRIWQSLGNHDLPRQNDRTKWRLSRMMVKNARKLVTNTGSGGYHDKGSFNKWHDGFCGDSASASYVYKKNGVAFINVQLAPNARFVRVRRKKHKDALNGPSAWLMDLLDDRIGCFKFANQGLKGVFLMHHYPSFCDGSDWSYNPPVDCPRWNEVAASITRFNNDPTKPRVMAHFVGHLHWNSGYAKYDKLHNLPGNVHRFYCGGLEMNTYLDVEVYPDGNKPYYVVYSNAVDPNGGKPHDKIATGFKRRCINILGPSHTRCTRWNFDGTTCEKSSSCPIASNPRI